MTYLHDPEFAQSMLDIQQNTVDHLEAVFYADPSQESMMNYQREHKALQELQREVSLLSTGSLHLDASNHD